MKEDFEEATCHCCGDMQTVPKEICSKVFICDECEDLHRENSARDFELEFELSQEVL